MPLFIPSPSISSFQLGPLTIHIYALCLITGIIVAWTIGVRRWHARGGTAETFETVLLWAIPIGIVGARLYHVLTHLGDYFAPGATQHWWAIWEGGIAIYGAIGFGALAAWIAARQQKIAFAALADALAPGIAVGQAIGRFGNWFNQELYGQPTDLPWGLEIDPAHRAPGFEQYATFHPTFIYESLWNLFVFAALIWADRRFRLGRGKVFALYVALYGFGRIFTEHIRLDYSYDTFGPIRFNEAVAMLICLAGVALFAWLWKFRPGREEVVEFRSATPAEDGGAPSE
nr:prolipoprotein diacylglyceryl transferase [Propionicimonas sp.]